MGAVVGGGWADGSIGAEEGAQEPGAQGDGAGGQFPAAQGWLGV